VCRFRRPDRCDAATGTVTFEEWSKNNILDRADGPALIRRYAATGIVTREEWWKDGKRDRADGPAYVERDAATGKVAYEEWWKDGKKFEPSAEVRAAWLQKSGERIAPPAVAKPAPAPG
jgi:hypothetical protein